MKKNTLKSLLGISFIISIIGFLIDSHERVEDIYLNIFEIVMMTIIVFALMFTILKTTEFVKRRVLKD